VAELEGTPRDVAAGHARAVLTAVRRSVTAGAVDHATAQLPDELDKLLLER
jgi:uncharacterized protein (DUF2267 family)